jgi:hypothetical protein
VKMSLVSNSSRLSSLRSACRSFVPEGGMRFVSSVFDNKANAFALDIDKAIEDRCYRRGELFVYLANRTIPHVGTIWVDIVG